MFKLFTQIMSIFIASIFSLRNPNYIEATKCSKFEKLKYCYYQGHQESDHVIYFLHGFANNVHSWSWNDVTKKLEKNWRKNKIKRPHTVTINFDRFWVYSKKEHLEQLNSFKKWFEQKYKLIDHTKALYGDSMGGHNSLRWFLDQPDSFSKLAIICPAITRFLTKEDNIQGWWPFNHFANLSIKQSYQESLDTNPLKGIKESNQIQNKKIFIGTTIRDEFGFFPGNKKLYQILKQKNPPIIYHEDKSRHCNIQVGALSKFLVN